MKIIEIDGSQWLDMGNCIQQVGGETRNDENFSDMLDRHMGKYSKVWKELSKY